MDPAIADDEQPGTEADAADRIIAVAARLGVEINVIEAQRWIHQMANEQSGGDIVVDVDSGVYGHRVADARPHPKDLARFREIGQDRRLRGPSAGRLTALALSGLGGPGQDPRLPGGRDFFERIHIAPHAATRLRHPRRDHARQGAGHAVRPGPPPLGSEVGHARRGGHRSAASAVGRLPISWTPERGARPGQMVVTAGRLGARRSTGRTRRRAGLVQARLGRRRPDPRHAGQREQRARPDLGGAGRHDRAARRLPGPLLPGGLPRRRFDPAVHAARRRISAPTRSTTTWSSSSTRSGSTRSTTPNYGKAARRMYNVFRLTGRYTEAAYLRELFDEPVTALYQVAALIRTLDDAAPRAATLRGGDDGRPRPTS